jgi:hypothetical protein
VQSASFNPRAGGWIAATVLLLLAGCLGAVPPLGSSRLAQQLRPNPLPSGPNGVVMELAYLERPFGDPSLNRELWQSADEDSIDPAVRQRWAANGFRVGLLGGQMSATIKALFDEQEQEQDEATMEQLRIQAGSPTQVQTSGLYEVWPAKGDRDTASAEHKNAMGTIRIIPRITSDCGISLHLTPEIQHGELRRLFVPAGQGGQSMDWSLKVARQFHSLDELSFSIRLRGDQSLMLGCVADQRDSLGAKFFSRFKDDRPLQRVLLVHTTPSEDALAARTFRP